MFYIQFSIDKFSTRVHSAMPPHQIPPQPKPPGNRIPTHTPTPAVPFSGRQLLTIMIYWQLEQCYSQGDTRVGGRVQGTGII